MFGCQITLPCGVKVWAGWGVQTHAFPSFSDAKAYALDRAALDVTDSTFEPARLPPHITVAAERMIVIRRIPDG